MSTLIDTATVLSSLGLWLSAYVFFRWIPGNALPPAIYSLLAINLSSVVIRALATSPDKSAAPEETKTPAPDEVEDVRRPAPPVSTSQLQDPLGDKPGKPVVGSSRVTTLRSAQAAKQARPSPWSVWTGRPTPTVPWLSRATVVINLLLTTIVADVVYRGHYWHPSHELSLARAGFVSDSSAKILIREPNAAHWPVVLSYRNVDEIQDDAWTAAGTVDVLTNATDFTAALTISDLEPETRYQYTTSTNHSGSFVTAPRPGERPRRNHGTYTFLSSSCLKPRFPYNPLLHPLSIPGLRHLAKWIPELQPQFMLFLGDFIYIDTPKRFGTDNESYRREYRMTYNSPDWLPASRYLPWIHVLDDHEIENDWDRNTTGVYQQAAEAWEHFHTSVNPPAVRPQTTYFSFTQGPASFFLLDTRRYRSSELPAPPDSPEKTMLGAEQLRDFLTWLRQPASPGVKWKVIASSVPLTKNWRFNNKDTWGGYLVERQKVLEAMWDAGQQGDVGVVVVSGDRHEFAATSFPPPLGGRWPMSSTVHEFSTSPLNQFYLPTRTYKQKDEEDVMIKYIPDGNSKFGALEITTPAEGEQSVLRFRLFVDGVESWSHVLTTS